MSLPSQASRSDSPSPPSSGVATPPPASSPGPPTLSSSFSSMWGSLIRRFSSDSTVFPQESSSPPYSRSDTLKDNGVFNPVRTASPFRPPPLDPVVLHGYKDTTPQSARILTHGIAEEIRIMVPERLRIVEDWKLVYSLEQDGASLQTLYKKCRLYEGRRLGFVIVVKDGEGAIFGAYLNEYPHTAPKYFGNGECFLWRASMAAPLPPPPSADTTNMSRSTTIASPRATTFPGLPRPESNGMLSPMPESIRFKAFPYSGINDYYINCEAGFLSVGAGDGHYGLWIDDALERGRSSRCDTFGNEPLSDEGEKFGILGVELWVLGDS